MAVDLTPPEIAPGHRVRRCGGAIVVDADDDRSQLLRALERNLVLEDDGGIPVAVLGDRVRVRFGDRPTVVPLTAFEARFLADNGVPLPTTHESPSFRPRTDLHTHFAAALSGESLVAVAAANETILSIEQLMRTGIHVDAPTSAALLIDAAKRRLASSFDLPLDAQSTFKDMEERYLRRAVVTKNPALLRPQLWCIAETFRQSGVTYSELSLSTCLEPVTLALFHDELDVIEQKTGVKLRFLVALSRHDDIEWDLDVLARLERCLDSRAVVGVDMMGQETCSTERFLPVLRAAAELSTKRPGLVIRVHAGENPAFPQNVRQAFEALKAFDSVEIRIGHGVYGVDDALMAEMASLPDRVIVEFNLTSNLALNNIQSTLDVPLKKYLDAGVSVVLGTDGAGLYNTSATDEAKAALSCGLTEGHFARLARVEEALIHARTRRESKLPSLSSFRPPAQEPRKHWSSAVAEREEKKAKEQGAALRARLDALHATVIESGVPDIDDRPILWVSGAWENAIKLWDEANLSRAEDILRAVVIGLSTRNAVILTGGTSHGVEGMVHGFAAEVNLPVIGAIVAETRPADLDSRVRSYWRCAKSLYEKAEPVLSFVRDRGGMVLFVGGGVVVADELQAAENMAVRHGIVSGFPGATAEVARMRRSNPRQLNDAESVLAAFDDKRPVGRLRHAGLNAAVDLVVFRTNRLTSEREVLLIRRHDRSGVEAGRLALPGGFLLPNESARAAAIRVLDREVRLKVDERALRTLCVVEGGVRDARNTADRWVRSEVFVLEMDPTTCVVAGSGASLALFSPVNRCPPLAFDHTELVRRALPITQTQARDP